MPSSPGANSTVNENEPSSPTATDCPSSEGRPPNCTVSPGTYSSDTVPVKTQVVPETSCARKFRMEGGALYTVAPTALEVWPQPSVTVPGPGRRVRRGGSP